MWEGERKKREREREAERQREQQTTRDEHFEGKDNRRLQTFSWLSHDSLRSGADIVIISPAQLNTRNAEIVARLYT